MEFFNASAYCGLYVSFVFAFVALLALAGRLRIEYLRYQCREACDALHETVFGFADGVAIYGFRYGVLDRERFEEDYPDFMSEWTSSTAYKLGGQLVEMTQFRNELDRLGSLTADLDARVKCECRNAGTLQWGLF